MVVGGWNDEQNLYGILNSYKKIENSPNKKNTKFIMGPWSHGHPTALDSAYYLGDVFYGYNLSKNYLYNDEFAYYEHHLKQVGKDLDFKVKLYDTGLNKWSYFDEYPKAMALDTFFLANERLLRTIAADNTLSSTKYFSDPFSPVPFIEGDEFYRLAPKSYFTADQRFVSKRPDVISFETEILTEDLTVLGEVLAELAFQTNKTDADIYVKIIDVYPMDREGLTTDPEGVKMNGYQQLVRCGYIRSRYRDSFENPTPIVANTKTAVDVPLLDIYHTFKKGHKIMIQIQSSMFPLFDLNPQNYIEDIYNAKRSDFTIAEHQIFSDSRIIFPRVNLTELKD